MASARLIELFEQSKTYVQKKGIDLEVIRRVRDLADICIREEDDWEYGREITKYGKWLVNQRTLEKTHQNALNLANLALFRGVSIEEVEIYFEFTKMESKYLFESFLVTMERYRPYEKKFYLPRYKTLKVVVNDLQDLEDGKYKFYGLSMPSRTGKSTTCIFFLAWIMMKRPNSHNAIGGHSGILAKGFHKEVLNLITSSEYAFDEMYKYWHPNHQMLQDKSAEEFTINLDEPDRFSTLTCRGIDGTWTGAVDVSGDGYLYVDDLVRDREHSLSPTRMENTFQEYLNKMVDRKNDGSRELMVGTLWNVLDPLERMRTMYEDNPDYKFRRLPALDDNDESNFDYEINGFSTQYYREMRDRLDNAEWMAKYQQKPFVREGLLYPVEELRFFNGVLPEGDHKIVAVCDVAFGGGDSLSMPIGYQFEDGDTYIFDWVFSSAPKEVTIPEVVGKIVQNEIREMRFEANRGGDIYADLVDKELRKVGWKCSCTSKQAPNNMEKTSKIIAYSGDVKRNFIFLQAKKPTAEETEQDLKLGIKRYSRSSEYQKAMDELSSFVTIGKNVHDDAVDGITQLQMFIEKPMLRRQAVIMSSPF